MKSILLTGATGYLGRLLIKKLNDYRVFIFARDEENVFGINKAITIIRTDYSFESLNRVFPKEIDVVIHMAWAGVNGLSKGDVTIQEHNISISTNVAKVSILRNVHRFIGIETISEAAYLNNKNNLSPSIIYGKYKHLCFKTLDCLFDNTETIFTWLRLLILYSLNNISGNILRYTFSQLLANKEAVFGPCEQY